MFISLFRSPLQFNQKIKLTLFTLLMRIPGLTVIESSVPTVPKTICLFLQFSIKAYSFNLLELLFPSIVVDLTARKENSQACLNISPLTTCLL